MWLSGMGEWIQRREQQVLPPQDLSSLWLSYFYNISAPPFWSQCPQHPPHTLSIMASLIRFFFPSGQSYPSTQHTSMNLKSSCSLLCVSRIFRCNMGWPLEMYQYKNMRGDYFLSENAILPVRQRCFQSQPPYSSGCSPFDPVSHPRICCESLEHQCEHMW